MPPVKNTTFPDAPAGKSCKRTFNDPLDTLVTALIGLLKTLLNNVSVISTTSTTPPIYEALTSSHSDQDPFKNVDTVSLRVDILKKSIDIFEKLLILREHKWVLSHPGTLNQSYNLSDFKTVFSFVEQDKPDFGSLVSFSLDLVEFLLSTLEVENPLFESIGIFLSELKQERESPTSTSRDKISNSYRYVKETTRESKVTKTAANKYVKASSSPSSVLPSGMNFGDVKTTANVTARAMIAPGSKIGENNSITGGSISLTKTIESSSPQKSKSQKHSKSQSESESKLSTALFADDDECLICEYYRVFGKYPVNLMKAYDLKLKDIGEDDSSNVSISGTPDKSNGDSDRKGKRRRNSRKKKN